jgi:hypothetical protein
MFSEVHRGETLKKSIVFEWHKWFKKGQKKMEDGESSDHPRPHRTEENVEKVWYLVHSNKHLSMRPIAVQLNLDKETDKL